MHHKHKGFSRYKFVFTCYFFKNAQHIAFNCTSFFTITLFDLKYEWCRVLLSWEFTNNPILSCILECKKKLTCALEIFNRTRSVLSYVNKIGDLSSFLKQTINFKTFLKQTFWWLFFLLYINQISLSVICWFFRLLM